MLIRSREGGVGVGHVLHLHVSIQIHKKVKPTFSYVVVC